jgi:hypothetical protein
LDRTTDQIRPAYKFDVTCQGAVPGAIIAFLESTNYESAVRLAMSLGGDSAPLKSSEPFIARPEPLDRRGGHCSVDPKRVDAGDGKYFVNTGNTTRRAESRV